MSVSRYDQDDPRFAGFTSRIDAVNASAERAEGFVWQLKSDGGIAIYIRASENSRFLINISVWTTARALEDFE